MQGRAHLGTMVHFPFGKVRMKLRQPQYCHANGCQQDDQQATAIGIKTVEWLSQFHSTFSKWKISCA